MEPRVGAGLLQASGTECSSACMGPFEGGHHYLHYPHHSLASGQIKGRELSPAHQQKIGLKIYLVWTSKLRKLRSWHLVPSLHGKQMGKQWKQWLTLFGGSYKITANGDCSHKIKRCLPLGRKVMTNLDSMLKSRDITLSTMVLLVKAMVFPVVMYGCESWTVKKAER